MIEVNHLVKHFGVFPAVKDINFTISKGEVVGLLGPNGAGKTTTMRMMTGYYDPSDGNVTIDGVNVAENKQFVQKQIGYLPESASSYSDMLVRDFLSFVGQARGLSDDALTTGIDKAVEATGLGKFFTRPISHLSKGFRQRVGLASALIHDPQVLILDEPTSGLDPNQIIEIQNLIKELAKEKTIILSTHILKEVEATCQRAIIISEGKIVLDESLDAIEKLKEGASKIHLTIKGRVSDAEQALKAKLSAESDRVMQTGITDEYTRLTVTSSSIKPEALFSLAVEKNWILSELYEQRQSLEEIFQSLTTGGKK